MTAQAGFWDRLARRYARQPVADEASYRHKLEATQRRFSPSMEVLEIGCGTGTTALIHAPFVKHIKATDLSGEMIAIAREKQEAQGIGNVSFERAAIGEIGDPAGSYDMVMAHSILHLVDDEQALIRQAFQWLKPGGLFVSSTTCLGGVMPYLRVVLPLGHALGLLPKVRFFTSDNLLAAMRAAGFTIEEQWQPGPKKALFVIARKPG